jgi:hypothetical protein
MSASAALTTAVLPSAAGAPRPSAHRGRAPARDAAWREDADEERAAGEPGAEGVGDFHPPPGQPACPDEGPGERGDASGVGPRAEERGGGARGGRRGGCCQGLHASIRGWAFGPDCSEGHGPLESAEFSQESRLPSRPLGIHHAPLSARPDRAQVAVLVGVARHVRDPRLPGARKTYVLDMFPYPSGDGLHVGHPEGYTATDIVARFERMRGTSVMHPMGFDAFGLPAEEYAIRTGTPPRESTERNIANFTRQLKMLGFSYDWDRVALDDRSGVRSLDAVDLPRPLRHLVRPDAAEGAADRRTADPAETCRLAAGPQSNPTATPTGSRTSRRRPSTGARPSARCLPTRR